MARIAFLGLGNMGRGMAGRLIAAGHDVRLYNRTRARAEALAGPGATVADTPREAADGVDAVFAMVGDDEASRRVWLGDDGALAAAVAPGALAIECSTLSYDWVGELAHAAADRGLCYIDAPVTGLPDAADAGELVLLVGAAGDDLGAVRPLLDPGDVVIDGGNSLYTDTARRQAALEADGLLYVGAGVSGGEEGARHGPSIMPGGSPAAAALVMPIFEAIAARADDGAPCTAWLGPGGSGHFVKMVHNGIEYGDMPVLA